jgi:hypothetical protein
MAVISHCRVRLDRFDIFMLFSSLRRPAENLLTALFSRKSGCRVEFYLLI